jgi:hypothetical protein
MNTFQLGQRAMLDAFNAGQRLDRFIETLSAGASPEEQTIFAGAVDTIVATYWAFRGKGLEVAKHDDPILDQFLHSGKNAMLALVRPRVQRFDHAWLNTHMTAVLRVLQPLAGLNPISLAEPAPTAPPPEPQAMPVRVVGMPERVTESSVAYDAQGNIKSAKQTEKDAV